MVGSSFIFNFKKISYSFLILIIVFIFVCNLDALIRGGKFVHKPNHKSIFTPNSKYIKDVDKITHFSINNYGLRGDNFGNEKFRILTIGNSLTECLYLDDNKTWSKLLQDKLRKKGIDVKIFNAGLSGKTSSLTLIKRFDYLKKYKFDLVILYGGGSFVKSKSDHAFSLEYLPDFSNPRLSLIKNITRLRVHELKNRIKQFWNLKFSKTIDNILIEDKDGKNYVKRRIKKQKAKIIKLDDSIVNNMFLNYKKGIERYIKYMISNKAKFIILPELDLSLLNPSKKEQNLMWGRLISKNGNDFKYSIHDEKKIIVKKMNIVSELCLKYNLSCIEPKKLLSTMSKDWFYDHHHFNNTGSKEFSNLIVNEISFDNLLKNIK